MPCLQQASSSASKGAPRAEGVELDLVSSQGAWVAASTLLLGLASGQLITVNLQADGGTVRRIKVSNCLPVVHTLLEAALANSWWSEDAYNHLACKLGNRKLMI